MKVEVGYKCTVPFSTSFSTIRNFVSGVVLARTQRLSVFAVV
jgi:hypothetical protein